MIRELGESIGRTVLDGIGRAASKVQERRPLAVDLLESDDAYLAVFDAPGATASDVQVRFEEGAVVVRVDRFREFYEDFEMRLPGRAMALHGRVALPEGASVDPDAARATLTEDGTLRVEVPKVEDEDRPVEISTSEESPTTSVAATAPSGSEEPTAPGAESAGEGGAGDEE